MTGEHATTADRLAILEQIARYSFAWDDRDLDAYLACFTPDARFETWTRGAAEPVLRVEGTDAIREWARAAHERLRGERVVTRAHNTCTVFDELTPERARTRTYLLQTRFEPDTLAPRPAVSGVYVDEWRRTPAGWRLAQRALRFDG